MRRNNRGDWELLDLSSDVRRVEALAEIAASAPTAGLGARSWNLVSRLGPDPNWSSLRVYVFRDQGKIIGIAPFEFKRRPLQFHLGEFAIASVQLDRLCMAGDVHFAADLSPDNRDLAVHGLLDVLVARLGPRESIYLEGLPTDGGTYQLLVRHKQTAAKVLTLQLGEAFNHQFISLPGSITEYLKQLGSRTRSSVQNRKRKLIKDMDGRVRAEVFSGVKQVETFVADASSVSRKTYQWHLLGLGLRDDEGTLGRLRFDAEQGWLRSYILYCRDQPCAFMLGRQYGDCYYQDDIGYDPEYARWGVGTVLQLMVLEEILGSERKLAYFDFSTGYGEHKRQFGNLTRNEANILVLPRSIRWLIIACFYRIATKASSTTVTALERLGLKDQIKRFVRRWKSR